MRGHVDFFDDARNYGFISPAESGKEDHFVHESDVESGTIGEGDIVEFESEEGEESPRAVNVRKIE